MDAGYALLPQASTIVQVTQAQANNSPSNHKSNRRQQEGLVVPVVTVVSSEVA